MGKKWVFWVFGGLSGLLGLISLVLAGQMWLGGAIILPVGFLFGVGEMNSYEVLQNGLINLWWHVFPGLFGFGFGLVLLILSGFLFLVSLLAWRRTYKDQE